MEGPSGTSIWAGTKNTELAWEWTAFLSSAECQKFIGDSATSYLPTLEGMEFAVAGFAAQGLDISVVSSYIENRELYQDPVFAKGAQIESEVLPYIQDILALRKDVDSLDEAAELSEKILSEP